MAPQPKFKSTDFTGGPSVYSLGSSVSLTCIPNEKDVVLICASNTIDRSKPKHRQEQLDPLFAISMAEFKDNISAYREFQRVKAAIDQNEMVKSAYQDLMATVNLCYREPENE